MVTGGPSLQASSLLNGEQAEGAMSLTRRFTDPGAWYVGLFLMKRQLLLMMGKDVERAAREPKSLSWLPHWRAPRP